MTQIFGIAKADFLERSRRFSFTAMLALALFGAFCFVPDNSSLNIILVDPDRFIQGGHPSWMTMASAWGLTFFLPLLGFFYVSGSLTFDEKTGISQLAAVSLSGGFRYMLAKFLSGAALLYCIILTIFLGSVIMMLIQFPGQLPSLYSVISPYLIFLPISLFISALAILFDSTRFLRKSIGAIAYIVTMFFVMMNTLSASMPVLTKATDISGYKIISEYIQREILAQTGTPMQSLKILAGPGEEGLTGTQTLIFRGIDWQPTDIWGLLCMAILSFALVGIAAYIYKATRYVKLARPRLRKTDTIEAEVLSIQLADYAAHEIPITNNMARKLLAEIRLTLAGMPVIWYLAALGVLVSGALIPLETAQAFLPLFLLWPLSIYSAMGCREHLHGTINNMAILPNGLLTQIILSWVSGSVISGVMLLPVTARMLAASQYSGVLVCFCGAVFVPSLALFLGELTQTRRAFEVIYVSLAYMVINGLTDISYLEVRPQYISVIRAMIFLVIGVVLGVFAIIKRMGVLRNNNETKMSPTSVSGGFSFKNRR